MNKFVSIASAVALAGMASIAAVAPSAAAPIHHHYNNGIGAGIAGGVLGFVAGAAIASSINQPHYGYGYYDHGPRFDGHVRACLDTYRSYDVRSDTYLGYDGYRYRCEL